MPTVIYRLHIMSFTLRFTEEFQDWFEGLTDREACRAIKKRLARFEAGLFGDVKYFRGIGELRVDCGPGYRVYFCRAGLVIYVMLCGGTKKTQTADIARAVAMSKEIEP